MWAKHKVERKKGSYRKAQEVDLASTSFHPSDLVVAKGKASNCFHGERGDSPS